MQGYWDNYATNKIWHSWGTGHYSVGGIWVSKGVLGRTWELAMGPLTLRHCLGLSETALTVLPSLGMVFEGWGMEK